MWGSRFGHSEVMEGCMRRNRTIIPTVPLLSLAVWEEGLQAAERGVRVGWSPVVVLARGIRVGLLDRGDRCLEVVRCFELTVATPAVSRLVRCCSNAGLYDET